ncbi:MAG TPA: hypothetical protein VGN43_05180, partial [Steroidobacteraceae bacterium]|nr:hypothetical protein [Steroidobacteraceae bacterium]
MRISQTLGAAAALFLALAQAQATTAITGGNARFEFLTPSLVRMEYSPSGKFIDAPTAVVQKRDWPAVQVTTHRSGGWLILATHAMSLRYRLDSGAFTAANL